MSLQSKRLRPSGASTDVLGELRGVLRAARPQRGMLFGLIILTALVAFELFNFSTTEFALTDLLGDLSFAGVTWATILAFAFSGMDFAGIARLLTPQREGGDALEVWYMLGAWFLAATMNAMLTWWAVSLALLQHQGLGNQVLTREELIQVVPVFVALLVWLVRVLIIGTFTLAGPRLFTQGQHEAPLSALRLRLRPQRRSPSRDRATFSRKAAAQPARSHARTSALRE
jgi:hypothetical protein